MTVRNISYLKAKFESGDKPTQTDFHDWIDTMFYLSGSDPTNAPLWNSTYETVCALSADWSGTQSTVVANSASWATSEWATHLAVANVDLSSYSLSNVGNLIINGDITFNSPTTVTGTVTSTNLFLAVTIGTSALCIPMFKY